MFMKSKMAGNTVPAHGCSTFVEPVGPSADRAPFGKLQGLHGGQSIYREWHAG